MKQQDFIQNLIDNTQEIFDEYKNCRHRDIPLPDWKEEQEVHQHWRALPIWWVQKPCKPVQKSLPLTTKLLTDGPGHRATAWVKLDSHSKTPQHAHHDWGNKIILHLPMIVPEGDVGFWVDGNIHRWKVGELFAFKSNQEHYGFNNTDGTREMLVMEFDDTWEQTLRPYMTVTP
mgnify:FL=1